jgi:hypothetical protein
MPPPAATEAAARLWTARVARSSSIHWPGEYPPTLPTPHFSWFRKTRFIRGRVRELKNAHNSVTVQNRTHVHMNFFLSQRPRKSPPAVMSTRRETPCVSYIFFILPFWFLRTVTIPCVFVSLFVGCFIAYLCYYNKLNLFHAWYFIQAQAILMWPGHTANKIISV